MLGGGAGALCFGKGGSGWVGRTVTVRWMLCVGWNALVRVVFKPLENELLR